MDTNQIMMLKSAGWTVECLSPLEIRHTDGSFATKQAALIVVADVQQQILEESYPSYDNTHLNNLIGEMKAGLSEIYANRGEDEFIAKICSPLIDRAQEFEG